MPSLLRWIDDRFPLTKVWKEHIAEYYAPKNFNFLYYFGAILTVMLVIQLSLIHISEPTRTRLI